MYMHTSAPTYPRFHLAFPVTDLAQARRFYGELLGCPEGRSSEDWVDFDFFGHQIVAHQVDAAQMKVATSLVDRPDDLPAVLADADALVVRNRTQVNDALLAAAPQLRVVGRLGVGLDNIDQKACAARGIEVIPATGANAQAVAEYVIGAALA